MKKIKDYILEQVAKKSINAEEALEYITQLSKTESPLAASEWAVIGMACRLPGANDPHEFWQNLIQQKDSVGAFPKNRIDDYKYVNHKVYEESKGLYCRIGTYLDRVDLFDNTFFGLTPAEARVMDPSQRIFLEVAYEAIENAGLTEKQLQGSKTGVYVGYSVNEDNYMELLSKNDSNVLMGNQPAMLAYRLSYLFDMQGPTMIVDTSCSSSLVAVHQACQAIANGDCDQAIVGGVNIRIFPAIREIANLGIEAFDGRCRTFDEKANGTNIGDGVAALVIKNKTLLSEMATISTPLLKAVPSIAMENRMESRHQILKHRQQ